MQVLSDAATSFIIINGRISPQYEMAQGCIKLVFSIYFNWTGFVALDLQADIQNANQFLTANEIDLLSFR